jgi:hypothetical protein
MRPRVRVDQFSAGVIRGGGNWSRAGHGRSRYIYSPATCEQCRVAQRRAGWRVRGGAGVGGARSRGCGARASGRAVARRGWLPSLGQWRIAMPGAMGAAQVFFFFF